MTVSNRVLKLAAVLAVVIVVLCFAALAAPRPAVAQNPYGGTVEVDFSSYCYSQAEMEAYSTGFTSFPANGVMEGICYLTGWHAYEFNTMQAFGLPCDQVVVYKVSPTRVQERWDNGTCSGNILTVNSAGNGHYVFYSFQSDNARSTAERQLITILSGIL